MKKLKFFFKFILAFILVNLIFWTIVLATLQTKQGQTWAFAQLMTYLENQTQTQIQIGQVHFSFPLNLSLENVAISQDDYPLVNIQNIELCCTFSNLLQGRIIFSKLHASHIDIQHISKHPDSTPSATAHPWEAP